MPCLFSSESVGEGHPDKVADYIADSILDACLEQDPKSRVACEVLVKSNFVFLAGEITTQAHIDYDQVTRDAIRHIGYVHANTAFHADKVSIVNIITPQSPDTARGVDGYNLEGRKTEEQGAGDQGIMFGYACNETEELMPCSIVFAHRLMHRLTRYRKEHPSFHWLRPDSKAQVTVRYADHKPIGIKSITISAQHAPGVPYEKIKDFCINHLIRETIPNNLLSQETQYFINPTGKFITGGPQADAGLTGRKVIADTYGGWGRHGGGAFSGKDPSKMDRSAAYYCRWVAKNIVAAGIAPFVEVQIAYVFGCPEPISLHVNTFGSSDYEERELIDAIKQTFHFHPTDIIRELDLLRPIYRQTTNYGHFGKKELPWEKTNKVKQLQELLTCVCL